MIETDKISEIVNKIVSGYNTEKIILFGSYATGNPNEDSDLDLFVIKDTDLPRPQRTVQVRKMIYGETIYLSKENLENAMKIAKLKYTY